MHDNVNYNGPMEVAFAPTPHAQDHDTVVVYMGPAGTGQTKTKACQTVG